jgi:hypothetical protein
MGAFGISFQLYQRLFNHLNIVFHFISTLTSTARIFIKNVIPWKLETRGIYYVQLQAKLVKWGHLVYLSNDTKNCVYEKCDILKIKKKC